MPITVKKPAPITRIKESGNIQASLNYFTRLKIPRTKKILDIGCNFGSLISKLYQLGYSDVSGIDIKESAVAQGKKLYPDLSERLYLYPGRHLPFAAETFDVVTMFDVLEHIPEIEYFIKHQVWRVLRKDGLFVFRTPNKHINIPWEIIHQRSLSKWKKFHCSLQTTGSLKRMLTASGFTDINLEKGLIITDHNTKKIFPKHPLVAKFILKIAQTAPLQLAVSFDGTARYLSNNAKP